MKQKTYLGVDTGGTFTDFVLYDNHKIIIHKVLSTPDAPEKAILKGIDDLGLMTQLKHLKIVHGSTVATNAVLESKGVKTAYVANLGLKDVLSIGRQARKELYNLTPAVEHPPVPEELCFEIDVRRDYQGNVISELDDYKLSRLAKDMAYQKPQAIAINLLYSFKQSEDEINIEKYLRAYFKQMNLPVFISRSSAVLAEYKEYERGIATWINAWIGPKVSGYIERLKSQINPARLTIMQSSGGTIDADNAARNAVRLLLSGPAGGLQAARFIAEYAGEKQLLSFDMGGTSTDVALIEAELKLTNTAKIGNYPVSVPMVDMHTIGAGGGSIAYIDSGGLLQVGPQSAGAKPGPACYALGGKNATVTDANLILGRLSEKYFLGGTMYLDRNAAEQAIDQLADKLKLDRLSTAQGIIDIANEHMSRALRVMSVQKGIDPAQLSLVSFGGAGALHVCALAEKLNMNTAIIPSYSGVLSALGMLIAPASRDLSLTSLKILSKPEQHNMLLHIQHHLKQLQTQGMAELINEGIEKTAIATGFSMDLRYMGQSYTLPISFTEKELYQPGLIEICIQRFHQSHQQHYAHQHTLDVELVTLHVQVTAQTQSIELPKLSTHSPIGNENDNSLLLYQREQLIPGTLLQGPALIVEQIATTYLAKNWSCRVDDYGNLLLTLTKPRFG